MPPASDADIDEPHRPQSLRAASAERFPLSQYRTIVGVVIQGEIRLADQFLKSGHAETTSCTLEQPVNRLRSEVPDVDEHDRSLPRCFELVRLDLDDLGTSASDSVPRRSMNGYGIRRVWTWKQSTTKELERSPTKTKGPDGPFVQGALRPIPTARSEFLFTVLHLGLEPRARIEECI